MKIAVIGSGSAGILSLCHLLKYLPEHVCDLEIYSISDPSIPPISIGESANPVFLDTIRDCLKFDEEELFEKGYIDATLKVRTLYKNWRKEDFFNPLFAVDEDIEQTYAIHFNTFKIKDFVFDLLRKEYPDTFIELYGNVASVKNVGNAVDVSVDGKSYVFDFVVDCRGFPKEYGHQYKVLPMPLNHGLVHNVEESHSYNDWQYTLHQATEDGWLFGVPLRTRTSYGYLFNDEITDVDTAKNNFAKLLNVEVGSLQNIEHKFRSYYTKKLIDGRIIRNGNCAVFLEPMFANSLWLYDYAIRLGYDHILGNTDNVDELNFLFVQKAQSIHDFICVYYKRGSIFNTPFWEYASKYAEESLKDSLMLSSVNERFKFMKEHNCRLPDHEVLQFCPFSISTLIKIGKFFNYDKWNIN